MGGTRRRVAGDREPRRSQGEGSVPGSSEEPVPTTSPASLRTKERRQPLAPLRVVQQRRQCPTAARQQRCERTSRLWTAVWSISKQAACLRLLSSSNDVRSYGRSTRHRRTIWRAATLWPTSWTLPRSTCGQQWNVALPWTSFAMIQTFFLLRQPKVLAIHCVRGSDGWKAGRKPNDERSQRARGESRQRTRAHPVRRPVLCPGRASPSASHAYTNPLAADPVAAVGNGRRAPRLPDSCHRPSLRLCCGDTGALHSQEMKEPKTRVSLVGIVLCLA